MAKRDKREAGKSFIEQVLAKLPEDKRGPIREALVGAVGDVEQTLIPGALKPMPFRHFRWLPNN